MKLNKTILITAILTTSTSNVSAYDGKVNFTGQILAATCKVNGNGTGGTQEVPLGNISSSAFSKTGDYAGAREFKVLLSGCEASAKSATVSFDGKRDESNLDLLELTNAGSTGVASGVAIGIYESDSSTTIPMLKSSNKIDITNGSASFSFVAKYVATANKVTAGSANGSATFTISYN